MPQQQFEMFDPPKPRAPHTLARSKAPATSRAAAASVVHFATAHHVKIVQALKDHGSAGLTVFEIAKHSRLEAHAIGKRMNELEAGKVVRVALNADGSEQARPGPSGRKARVWLLTGAVS